MSIPTQIGRYQVVGHLASGGMAEILLGKLIGPSGFERPVVIKRILPHLARRESFVNMFLDEARVVARIRHPNVVHVQELGHDDDELFMVMEYLEGESLLSIQRRARRQKMKIDIALGAHIVAQACAGLHAAHELTDDAGNALALVHRDVSPHNIFVTYDGSVKLLDFGIAKFAERSADTEAGQLKGKFPYMSPEQCLGKPLDRRADIFSLGTILFELTTGRRLFARETGLLSMRAIIHDRIPSPVGIDPLYPAPLARVVMRALAREPEDRFQTAAEMRRELVTTLREIGLDEIPEEALGRQMQLLFVDRKNEKEEMLRRVSTGSAITSVPEAEVDVSIELPAVTGATGQSQPSTPFAIESPMSSGGGLAFKLGLAASIGVGIALGLFVMLKLNEVSQLPPEPPNAAAGSADAPATPTEPAPAPAGEPAPLPEPTEVTLHVRSTPVGATVSIDGEDRGVTPLEITLPRSEASSVAVVVAHAGYESAHEEFLPSEDGRIVAALSPSPAPAPAAIPASNARVERTRPAPTGMRASNAAEAPPASPFRRFN